MLGNLVNGKKITEKDIKYTRLIDINYKKIYRKCKKLLGDKIEN